MSAARAPEADGLAGFSYQTIIYCKRSLSPNQSGVRQKFISLIGGQLNERQGVTGERG